MYGVGGASFDAGLARETERVVDVGQIVGNGDGSVGAALGALAAADAGHRADFAGDDALVAVVAGYVDAGLLPFAQLDDVAGAGFHARPAGNTDIGVDDGQPGDGVHGDAPEVASGGTVAFAQTAVVAVALARVECGFYRTAVGSLVVAGSGPVFTRAVAAHYRNAGCLFHGFHSHDGGNLLHDCIASHGTQQIVERGYFGTLFRKVATAGKAAAATVGSREHRLDFVDTRVFLDVEFAGNEVEQGRTDQSDNT